jgi:uncharacterized membrane protein
MYDWLKFLHIVAAMVWVGGGVVVGAFALRVLRDPAPDAVARFVGTLRLIGPLVLAPATVAVIGLGTWLVLDSTAWSFSQFWIQLAVGLFAGAFLVGAVFQSRAAINADRAAAAGDHDEARRQLGRWALGYALIVLLLIAATWDMVFKPGL